MVRIQYYQPCIFDFLEDKHTLPRTEFTPLIEFAFNQVQSLIENMMSRVAATVDPGGRVIWEKSRDCGNLFGTQNKQEDSWVSFTEQYHVF